MIGKDCTDEGKRAIGKGGGGVGGGGYGEDL